MEPGSRSGQRTGGADTAEVGWDRAGRLLCGSPPGTKHWQGEVRAAGGPRRARRVNPRVNRTARGRPRGQFAEAFYLMVMASDLRERARALGRRYGLDAMEVRAEILRYIDRLAGELAAHAAPAAAGPSGPAETAEKGAA